MYTAHFITLIDSVCNSDKSYYPQRFFEGCKYMVKGETKRNLTKELFDSDSDFDCSSFNHEPFLKCKAERSTGISAF